MHSDQEDMAIDVLGLSRHVHNLLWRAGIDTVAQLVAMCDDDLLNIPMLGLQSLVEIKRNLEAFLTTPSTALKVLGLSAHPHNALMRQKIVTVEQLAAMSEGEIKAVRNIGDKSMAEIKHKLEAYLAMHTLPPRSSPPVEEPKSPSSLMAHPQVLEVAQERDTLLESNLMSAPHPSLTQEPEPLLPSPCIVDTQVLEVAHEQCIPLDSILIERLALPESVQSLLHSAGIETIGALARQPRDKWQPTAIIKWRLEQYLDWVVEQKEDVWASEQASHGLNPLHRLALAETTLEVLTTSWLSALSDRQRQIVRWRYGLDGEKLRLEDIAERIGGVSRARVSQIQGKAERRLSHPARRREIRLVKLLLIDLLEEAGGVASEPQIEAALRREMIVGDVDPLGASRLVFESHSDFERLGAKIWGLACHPLVEVEGVQEQMTRVLEKAHAPLPANEVISRLKQTRFSRDRQDKLPEAFVNACLRAHPDLVCGDDNCYGLKRWGRSRLDEIVQALRQIGEPAHYTAIAEKANAMLDPDMQTSAHNIHAILGRRKDLFVWAGTRGTYGLREWGLEKPPSYEEACVRILESAERPLTLEEILARFQNVRRRYNENSVSMTLMMGERFLAFADGTYGLSSWRLADERVEETSAHEKDLKRKVAELLGICSPLAEST